MGFFAKWAEGRIDDPEWRLEGQGRCGRRAPTATVFHVEGGKENRPKVVKFQMRPDPLAR